MARRNVTLAQIARRTGVHVSTVSRALNERTRHLVAENVAARIVATADALGYRPNVMAAALRTRRSRAVGIVVDTIADPAQLATLAGIEAALHEAGYVMTLTATGGDPQRLAATLDTLAGRGSDGAILLDRPPPAPDADGSAESDDPASDGADAEPPLPLVAPADIAAPDAAAAALAVDHLVRRGHRAIGFLAAPAGRAAATARLAGFRDAMSHAGLFVTAIGHAETDGPGAGATAAEALLTRRPNLTALVGADEQLALGALAALAARGQACPGDVSVVGIGDPLAAAAATPALTSVAIDADAIGRRAVAMLLARLDGTDTPPPLPAPVLVERRSTRPATARRSTAP